MKSPGPSDTFTVDQANAMLPLVRAITSDVVRLHCDIVERRKRLRRLLGGRTVVPGDPYTDELVQIQEELEKDVQRLGGYQRELRELNVELTSPTEGRIDFPSQLDGKPIRLCWQLGEIEVSHWHSVDEDFSDRRPLPVAVGTGGPVGSEF